MAIAIVFVGSVSADDNRYTAVFSDGSRIAGGHLTEWGNNNQPKLNGRPLFDQSNHIRWLKKETVERTSQPNAFVEFVGGDCLPARVIGFGGGTTLEFGELPAHLLVEPTVMLTWPEGTQTSRLRVLTRWLRRIVWERRSSDQYEPGTLYFKDGRQLAFRSIRFNKAGASVLTDAERREVRFSDLAELDMPRVDWWDAYFDQVALLTPDCKTRLTRIETLDGLKVTTSADRFQPMVWGDQNNPDCWFHAVQPAWSLDPLWVRHARVLERRFFGPHEVPLSLIEPSDVKLRSALSAGWRPQVDRNVQGGPLVGGGQEAGWGLGMHAYTEMHFPLPGIVQSFRSRVGLDHVVGKGGCARAIVYANQVEAEPLFRSKHLIGSEETVDTGSLAVTGGKDAELILVAHPAHADRPEGADPFDIRDVVDWLEPQVNLDLNALRTDVRRRLMGLLPGWNGWTLSGGGDEKLVWLNRWDGANSRDRRFHLEFRPREASFTLTRKLTIEPDQNWLMLYADRNPDGNQTSPTQMIVRIDGKQAGDYADLPARWQSTAPQVISVEALHNRTVTLEVRFVTRGDKSFVDWRSIALVDKLPGLAEVFEDSPLPPIELKANSGQNAVVSLNCFSGSACIKVAGNKDRVTLTNLNLPIRENPRFGEYRYICFAWRKQGGQQIAMDLEFASGGDTAPAQDERSQILKQMRRLKDMQTMMQRRIDGLRAMEKQRPLQPRQAKLLKDLEHRKQSGEEELKQLETDLAGGANAARPAAAIGYRYTAGNPPPAAGEFHTNRLADRALPQWAYTTRDLYEDTKATGADQLTSITLTCPDGEYALFDHIYLARTPQDFDHAPRQGR
jgi:hypothetical protein